MARPSVQNPRAELNVARLDDQELHELVAGIKQVSSTSSLITGSPLLQTSVAALLTKDAAFAQASTNVNNDRSKLNADLATETTCRNDLQVEVRAFVALAQHGAKSAADLQGAGLVPRGPIVRSTLPPDVPEAIDTILPKTGRGKVWVSVHETVKGARRQYAAQYSPDPYGPTTWLQLGAGSGKKRLVTGASGAKVWVRFATVRGGVQSDWSTPVLVTIP